MNRSRLGIVALLGLSSLALAAPPPPKLEPVDFNRDVRPLLSNHCLKCHGPDDKQRQAGLRLDQPPTAAALQKVLQRIGRPAADPLVMPPAHTNKPLGEPQKAILRRWITTGAKYAPHWAFVPVKAPAPGTTIDSLVRARLKPIGLAPMPAADRYTLIRRVSLDLIGLPPTPEEVDAFINDKAPNAYERVVERLLASPAYGERWARKWLDLARYADTNGYEKDKPRIMWPWRDWVIDSLNADLPFDQFTIQQLAGDLLPSATQATRVATGFHRNTMINEEGGIDPLEYRFHAMVDRMATTGATWLGLTVQCAQCHTHKYDPVTQKDYYRLMAFLDNADEPELDVWTPALRSEYEKREAELHQREAALADAFPVPSNLAFAPATPETVTTRSGAAAQRHSDGSVLITGTVPDTDTYTLTLPGTEQPVTALRLEALTDPSLGGTGPGRTPHGNFVLTQLTAECDGKPVAFSRAEADATQDGFSPAGALDNDPRTGWAIYFPSGKWNVNRTAVFTLSKPIQGKHWTVTLRQDYGQQHTLGKFRLSFGAAQPDSDPRPLEQRRQERREAAYAAWLKDREAKAVAWQILRPVKAKANLPLLEVLADRSILASGDQSKRDVYELDFAAVPKGITALRIEALPDERLPRHGPGRVYYEGSPGDFYLSELTLSGAKLVKGVSSVGSAPSALDGNPQTAWTCNGTQGKPSVAIFTLDKPLDTNAFRLTMVFEMYYAAGLGRFRISATTDPRAGQSATLPEVEDLLALPAAQRTAAQNARLFTEFLRMTPELASERAAIDALRRALPTPPTTLIFAERPAENPRPTFIRNRGEFLQPTERVTAGLPAILPPLPKGTTANRLSFARWLVSPQNPLTARVTVNRAWAAFFGRGIVRTTEDFGYQGEPPTHPELLDWLAWTFVHDDHWSLKKLHRRIVLSATYRQESRLTPQARAKDPENKLYSRGPRVRLDAELLRDQALAVSGLLSRKRGGPSVFPPQPAGVTTEGAYGPLAWNVSMGEDRYRRGLYTFAKRTAPYAMFATFDAPSGEATCPRREQSNTPLQALTLLNDQVFIEAAQALGKRVAAQRMPDPARVHWLFRAILSRPPSIDERDALFRFAAKQRTKLQNDPAAAKALAGGEGSDTTERAVWTTVARVILNLDEAIVKR